MERREPLGTRSPNRPIPPISILRKTIQAPSAIRKATTAQSKLASSPGKSTSPARPWASNSTVSSPTKTPKPRPISMIEQPTFSSEEAPTTVRKATVPSTIQRVHKMFDAIPPSTNKQPLQTPCRPPQSDLLISFETPAPNSLNAQPPTTRKTLLDIDDLFVPQTSDYNEEKLAELITSTLESERQKWQREVEMRHSVELETLAADLHAQYREKHTRKVEALKVTYKRQYEKKINSLEERVKELEGQLEEVRGELERERVEKRELIEMSEELMRLTAAQTVGEN